MYLLGYDIGSSFIKTSLISAESGNFICSAHSPDEEMEIVALHPGWAEQTPELWWKHLKIATHKLLINTRIEVKKIVAIGISYQMHGLVLIDKNKKVLRNAIIWCDSRAVDIGNKAFTDMGRKFCLSHYLNSPGNFTASKLKWVKNHEPAIYAQIDKLMFPGDYVAMRLTDKTKTTAEGLSQGIMWDFQKQDIAASLFRYYDIPYQFIPQIVPTFSYQGQLTKSAADELGLNPGIPVSYRAGDQPNNAFSLNVLEPGETAATAGTSGVIFGVSSQKKYDNKSRVNTFLHVNHKKEKPRLGVLLCINGTGILYHWLKKNFIISNTNVSYADMDKLAQKAPIGSDRLVIFPFGNGAERVLENINLGCQLLNLHFNIHTTAHLFRAAQEGIIFSLKYGFDILKNVGVKTNIIKAGFANMFLSPIFSLALATVTGATIKLFDTDGSQGAARGAGLGVGIYKNIKDAFVGLKPVKTIEPDPSIADQYQDAYNQWLYQLKKVLNV